MYEVAKDDLEFDTQLILDRFSLLTVAYNSPAIREYIDIKQYKQVDFKERIIPTNKLVEYKNLLTWIYGIESEGITPVLTDSRKITNRLSHVVQNKEAIEFLLTYKDLEEAYERTSGEKEYLANNIKRATRALETSLKFAYKHKKDKDLLDLTVELEAVLQALIENLQ